jgi:hypothetical protein
MYSLYTEEMLWSFPLVVSDGYAGKYWNDDFSYNPSIAVGNDGYVDVVWEDFTAGKWGIDPEIMHVSIETRGFSESDPPSDNNPSGINNQTISFGNVYLLLLVIGIVASGIIIYTRRKTY